MSLSFRCPHCQGPLHEERHEYWCDSGHHFDRAKEGYVNLVPGGRLKGRPSGDDDSMVRARRLVFDAGLYRPIIDAVATTVSLSAPASIVDAGCGEGSYLAQATAVSGAGGWGFDISKPAVRLASRRHTTHHYAIASSYAMPFSDDSFDAIINVFSPRDFGEMERVLVAGGVAVVVTPGPRHLAALKAMIYDDPREHLDRAGATDHAADTDEPSPDNIEAVNFELQLNDSTLRLALLEMTPFWWSTVPERRAAIAATDFTVEVDVRISTYRKTAT